MGKRKSSRKPVAKKKTVLEKTFDCVFCNHENSISTKFDFENKIAHLKCSACPVTWSTAITVLSEPIDVYSEWIDACQAANEKEKEGGDEHGVESDEEEDEF